jgi:hypothetical protein
MPNGEPLRIVVQVRTTPGQAAPISARYALRHVSWQGFHRVVQPSDVQGQLKQTRKQGHVEAILHVPVTHPLQFTRVIITVHAGAIERRVRSGVTFEPPTSVSQAPLLLTVPQVFTFCATRTRLPGLSYGMAIRGYARLIPTGGAGPNRYVLLAKRTDVSNTTVIEREHRGFPAWGFVNPGSTLMVTVVGDLICRPQISFGIRAP